MFQKALQFLYVLIRNVSDRNMNVTLLNTELATDDSLKLLGINIDNNLSWQTHIDIVQKRLVSLMCRIRMFLDEKNMILFYHAHFLTVIDYCINIWGHAAEVHIKRFKCCKIEQLEIF